MKISRIQIALAAALLACGVARAGALTGQELKKALQDNPDVLLEAIKSNKAAIFNIISQAAMEEQARQKKEA